MRVLVGVGAAVLICACKPEIDKTCRRDGMSLIVVKKTSNDENFPMCVDVHLASRIDATSTSPGRDESYPVSQPNAIPWTDIRWEDAVVACGRAGKYLCDEQVLWLIRPKADPRQGPGYQNDTHVTALVPTGPEASFPDHLTPIEPSVGVDWYFPDTKDSIAVWTRLDFEEEGEIYAPDQPLLFGEVRVMSSSSEAFRETPVRDKNFKHPLLGFRCCIDSRLDGVFEPFPKNEELVLDEVPDVPIADGTLSPDAGADQ